MKIDEFLKSIDYDAKMKVLGETKNFRYYVQIDIPDDEDIGVPFVVVENKNKHTFNVVDADRVFDVIDLFLEE